MRSTRGNTLQAFLFLISIGIIGGGVVYYMKRTGKPQIAISHSEPKKELTETSEHEHPRELSSEHQEKAMPQEKAVVKDEDESEETVTSHVAVHSEKSKIPMPNKTENTPQGASDKLACKNIEFRGDGFQGTQVTSSDWKTLLDLFHNSKRLLLAWLGTHRKGMTDKTIAYLESQIETMKLVRPPFIEEPDLNWRGIGVFSRDQQGAATVRLSSGFIKLFHHDVKRAQFEITRLLAQGWAPCELQKVGVESPWGSLLKCLEVVEDSACASGTYSESGWAVSSVLATALSPLDCKLPALLETKKK